MYKIPLCKKISFFYENSFFSIEAVEGRTFFILIHHVGVDFVQSRKTK